MLVGAVELEVDDLAELLCGLDANGPCSAVNGSREIACQMMLEPTKILSNLSEGFLVDVDLKVESIVHVLTTVGSPSSVL